MDNLNSSEYLSEIHEKVIENIRHLPGAPSMQILSNNPDKLLINSDDSDDEGYDERVFEKFIRTKIKLNSNAKNGKEDDII